MLFTVSVGNLAIAVWISFAVVHLKIPYHNISATSVNVQKTRRSLTLQFSHDTYKL